MEANSSPPQQDAVAESWIADFLVFGQALYHWAILPVYIVVAYVAQANWTIHQSAIFTAGTAQTLKSIYFYYNYHHYIIN